MWEENVVMVGARGRIGAKSACLLNDGLRAATVRLMGLWVLLLGAMLIVASPAGAAEACPNEQLREENHSTQLPDCRAYEMVSSPYTEGFNVNAQAEISARRTTAFGPSLTLDEGAILGKSFGVFAGAKNTNSPLGGDYLFRRTSSGWVTVPFDVPFTRFPDGEFHPIVGSDFRSSIWELGTDLPGLTPAPERDFYLREPSEAFSMIGPVAPAGARAETVGELIVFPRMLGASEDLTHLLFTSESRELVEKEPFWPDDSTIAEHPSLYEYVGTGNSEPTLVGVRNNGAVHGAVHVNEGAELISQCGTTLGGTASSNNAYNAVSSSGETVFLSAEPGGCEGFNPQTKKEEEGQGPPVREIYARIEGRRTVSISEPTNGPGGECETCQEGSLSPATYRAASADGSKAFFTTTQKLLPVDTDSTLDLYEYDFNAPAGKKIIQVSAGGAGDSTPGKGAEVQGFTTASANGEYVYFVAKGVLTTEPNPSLQPGHEKAVAGGDNLYVYEPDLANPGQHKTAFIAALAPGDAADWAGFHVNDNNIVKVTPNGKFLLFQSTADLTPGDTSTAAQLFQFDAETGGLTRVSIGHDGYDNNGNGNGAVEVGEHPFQSSDGAYVFFDSTVPLAPQAAGSAGFSSVYEYHDGQVYLISDGRDTTSFGGSLGSVVEGVSPSGADVYFTTGDSLLPSDTNTQIGIYDARADGGFPVPVQQSGCSDEACQGTSSPSSSSAGQAPASTGLSGTGNLGPSPAVKAGTPRKIKCAGAKKLIHGKCVKTRKSKKPKAKKTSHDNRRTK